MFNFDYLSVCQYIIDRTKEDKDAHFEDTRLLKLMKLVYISHGFFLSIIDQSFIEKDKFEAWSYGPVLEALFRAYKKGTHKDFLELAGNARAIDTEDAEVILGGVYDRYSKLETFSLVALTHRQGSPWEQIYRGYLSNRIIPDSLIKKYYKNLLGLN